jgi:hypothetical protein
MNIKDVLEEIMLNIDINGIRIMCNVDTNIRNVCNDKNFWIKKLKKDGYSLNLINYPINYKDWIVLYKLKECYKKSLVITDDAINTNKTIIIEVNDKTKPLLNQILIDEEFKLMNNNHHEIAIHRNKESKIFVRPIITSIFYTGNNDFEQLEYSKNYI